MDVLEEVIDVAANWKQLGLKLGLGLPTLEIENNKPKEFLRNMLKEWLRQNYDEKKYGIPSWTMLCKAVGSPDGGNNKALAVKIAKKYNISEWN